jgi:hypothetical protein
MRSLATQKKCPNFCIHGTSQPVGTGLEPICRSLISPQRVKSAYKKTDGWPAEDVRALAVLLKIQAARRAVSGIQHLPVTKEVDFTIRLGEKIGIVGRCGSGTSTGRAARQRRPGPWRCRSGPATIMRSLVCGGVKFSFKSGLLPRSTHNRWFRRAPAMRGLASRLLIEVAAIYALLITVYFALGLLITFTNRRFVADRKIQTTNSAG